MFLFQVSLESLCTLISSGNLPLLHQHCIWHETPVRHRQSPTYEFMGSKFICSKVKNVFFQEALLQMGEGRMFPGEPKNKNLFNILQDLANFFCKWLDSKIFSHYGLYHLYIFSVLTF
jgi:hypothetical protein